MSAHQTSHYDLSSTTDMTGGIYREKIDFIYSCLESNIDKTSNLLDVGCHDGKLASEISNRLSLECSGVDLTGEHLIKGHRLAEFFEFDFDTMQPVTKKTYDFVIACDVIEHVRYTDNFLDQMKSLLSEDGKLIISTPNLASLARRILLMFGISPYIEVSRDVEVNGLGTVPVGHVQYFTTDTFDRILNKHGFRIERKLNSGINMPGGFNSKLLGAAFPGLRWHLTYLCSLKK